MGRLIEADKLKTDLEKAISKNEDMDCLDFLRAASVIDAQPTAFDLSKDMQQYRAIGTVEECRAAVEKQTAKKISSAWCPSCKKYLTTQHLKGKYHCVYCGQKLDWSDEV